jgi:hypothetical protein
LADYIPLLTGRCQEAAATFAAFAFNKKESALSDCSTDGCHGNNGGDTRCFAACSNAYASSMSFGSLHAIPLKLTPNGPGFASNPGGNGGVGAFATKANGTITVG